MEHLIGLSSSGTFEPHLIQVLSNLQLKFEPIELYGITANYWPWSVALGRGLNSLNRKSSFTAQLMHQKWDSSCHLILRWGKLTAPSGEVHSCSLKHIGLFCLVLVLVPRTSLARLPPRVTALPYANYKTKSE